MKAKSIVGIVLISVATVGALVLYYLVAINYEWGSFKQLSYLSIVSAAFALVLWGMHFWGKNLKSKEAVESPAISDSSALE